MEIPYDVARMAGLYGTAASGVDGLSDMFVGGSEELMTKEIFPKLDGSGEVAMEVIPLGPTLTRQTMQMSEADREKDFKNLVENGTSLRNRELAFMTGTRALEFADKDNPDGIVPEAFRRARDSLVDDTAYMKMRDLRTEEETRVADARRMEDFIAKNEKDAFHSDGRLRHIDMATEGEIEERFQELDAGGFDGGRQEMLRAIQREEMEKFQKERGDARNQYRKSVKMRNEKAMKEFDYGESEGLDDVWQGDDWKMDMQSMYVSALQLMLQRHAGSDGLDAAVLERIRGFRPENATRMVRKLRAAKGMLSGWSDLDRTIAQEVLYADMVHFARTSRHLKQRDVNVLANRMAHVAVEDARTMGVADQDFRGHTLSREARNKARRAMVEHVSDLTSIDVRDIATDVDVVGGTIQSRVAKKRPGHDRHAYRELETQTAEGIVVDDSGLERRLSRRMRDRKGRVGRVVEGGALDYDVHDMETRSLSTRMGRGRAQRRSRMVGRDEGGEDDVPETPHTLTSLMRNSRRRERMTDGMARPDRSHSVELDEELVGATRTGRRARLRDRRSRRPEFSLARDDGEMDEVVDPRGVITSRRSKSGRGMHSEGRDIAIRDEDMVTESSIGKVHSRKLRGVENRVAKVLWDQLYSGAGEDLLADVDSALLTRGVVRAGTDARTASNARASVIGTLASKIVGGLAEEGLVPEEVNAKAIRAARRLNTTSRRARVEMLDSVIREMSRGGVRGDDIVRAPLTTPFRTKTYVGTTGRMSDRSVGHIADMGEEDASRVAMHRKLGKRLRNAKGMVHDVGATDGVRQDDLSWAARMEPEGEQYARRVRRDERRPLGLEMEEQRWLHDIAGEPDVVDASYDPEDLARARSVEARRGRVHDGYRRAAYEASRADMAEEVGAVREASRGTWRGGWGRDVDISGEDMADRVALNQSDLDVLNKLVAHEAEGRAVYDDLQEGTKGAIASGYSSESSNDDFSGESSGESEDGF